MVILRAQVAGVTGLRSAIRALISATGGRLDQDCCKFADIWLTWARGIVCASSTYMKLFFPRLTKALAATLALVVAAATISTGCSADPQPELAKDAQRLGTEDYTRLFRKPGSWPTVWEQPPSTGFQGRQGRCGPTALANLFQFLPVDNHLTPTEFIGAGAESFIGTAPRTMTQVLKAEAEKEGITDCLSFALNSDDESSWRWVNLSLANNRPFIALINFGANQLHYVTVVGATANDVIVMDDAYWLIPRRRFMDAWWPFNINHPVWTCTSPSPLQLFYSESAL
jgi:hypothetical protein